MSRVDGILWFIFCQLAIFFMIFSVYQEALEVYPTRPTSNASIHKNLYLDRHFSDFYCQQITSAAYRWSEATNHLAEFTVIRLPIPDMNMVYHDPDGIIITTVSEDYPGVIALNVENNSHTIAFHTGRTRVPMLAYVDGQVMDNELEKVTLHELGHAMGLSHVPEEPKYANQLMYPKTSLMSDGITDADLKQFCEIYHCDATKLKHEEESFHL